MTLWFSLYLNSTICLLLKDHFFTVVIFFLTSWILLFKSESIFKIFSLTSYSKQSFLSLDYNFFIYCFFIFSNSNSVFMSSSFNCFKWCYIKAFASLIFSWRFWFFTYECSIFDSWILMLSFYTSQSFNSC